ncbi:MAG TPA: FAD-binding oxidoreductase [Micromonosporaceae bacterium]|nr:FAD-binding oxidoreductase [Micromonosporaceae bacterium]
MASPQAPWRPAGPDDVIDGVAARFVAAPASTEEAADVLRNAAARDLAVVVRGGGTKQRWGAPPRRLDLIVDTHRLSGIVEHAAGDLIVVARAGTPMAHLQAELAPAGQQLALDSAAPGATIGGTVAAATSGGRRMLYGTARDLLIGITIVRADGAIAHAGGKVVKNVAGYDLGKLFTGSYGTLGLITECAFRLHPVPAATASVARRVDTVDDAAGIVAAVLGAQVVPSALEIDASPDGRIGVAVLLEGVPEGVAARATVTRRLLGGDPVVSDEPPTWFAGYPWRDGDVGLKLTAPLSRVPALLAATAAIRQRSGVALGVRGSAGTGVLYAGLPGATDPATAALVVETLRAEATEGGGHAVVLTAPRSVRERVDLWGPVPGLALMRRVKERFDPDGRLAPGRFVGGI